MSEFSVDAKGLFEVVGMFEEFYRKMALKIFNWVATVLGEYIRIFR